MVETSAPLTTRPCAAPVPEPLANAFNSPAVPPKAEAENESSDMSMVQAPCRRECRPASPHIALRACLARRPDGSARPADSEQRAQSAQRPQQPMARRGELMRGVVTERAVLWAAGSMYHLVKKPGKQRAMFEQGKSSNTSPSSLQASLISYAYRPISWIGTGICATRSSFPGFPSG